MKIEGSWFVIERLNDKSISITIKETEKNRSLKLNIVEGDAVENIHISQKAIN